MIAKLKSFIARTLSAASRERHKCVDCKHHRNSLTLGHVCWRDGQHSYISGEWESNARYCSANNLGLCPWFEPLPQAETHGGEE